MAGKPEDMGMSRSGRVRKKSSKLIDFESPEEADLRPKKNTATLKIKQTTPKNHHLERTVPPLQIKIPKKMEEKPMFDDDLSLDSEEFSSPLPKTESYFDESHLDYEAEDTENQMSDFKSKTTDLEEDDSEDNSSDNQSDSDAEVDVAGPSYDSPLPLTGQMHKQPSLYLQENAKKKVVLKEAKLLAARQKTQRKDKGKTRYTAYMLWTKEMRPTISSQHPELKFDGVSKRLGELWATVSSGEKMTWKRRAMKQANKGAGGMISTGVVKPPAASRVKSTISPKARGTLGGGRGGIRPSSSSAGKKKRPVGTATDGYDLSHTDEQGGFSSPPPIQPRSCELEPLDVATHLHLLGEALSVVGTRLKETNGQIAVSGSLSVLLDSIVCALGPLLCLTRVTPETDGCPPETLSRILDNIAYIMPGL